MEFRKLTKNDAAAFQILVKDLNKNLTNSAWFLPMPTSILELETMLSKERFFILGAFENGNLIGVGSLDYKNGKLPSNYDFPAWCNVEKMVEFAFFIVLSSHRGKGIMMQLLQEVNNIALSQGYEFACCTVHENNLPSKKNLEKFGFLPYINIEQQTPYPRSLLLKPLT